MLSTEFQKLIPHQGFNAQPFDKASSLFQSSQSTAPPGLGCLPMFYDLSQQYGGHNGLTTADIDHNVLGTSYVGHHYLPQGFSSNHQGFAPTFIVSNGNNMISSFGEDPIFAEVITSPEQISSITACSDVDLYSDGECYDGGATLPHVSLNYLSQSSAQDQIVVQKVNQGELDTIDRRLMGTNPNAHHGVLTMASVENKELPCLNARILEQAFARISQGSNSLYSQIAGSVMPSHEDLSQHQLSQFNQLPDNLQFDELSKALLGDVALVSQRESSNSKERSLKLSQDPVEQEYRIQQQKSSSLQNIGASNIADSSILIQDVASNIADSSNLIQDVLLQYIHYTNDLRNKGKNRATFLKKWHDMKCQDKKCNCERDRALICHYENCRCSSCSICQTVRELRSSDTVQSRLGTLRSDTLKAIHDREPIGSGASMIECDLPPAKRMRREDCFISENVSSALVTDSADESYKGEGTSPYKKYYKGPLCNKENEEEMKLKQSCSPKDPIQEVKREKLCSAEDPYGALGTSDYTPENDQRMSYGDGPFFRGEFSRGTSKSDGLKSDILTVLEQPNIIQEKGEIHSTSKPNQPESKGKADSRETEINRQSGTSLEDPKKLPVSLIDFLSSVQINKHIRSLSQSMGQGITVEPKENLMENSVGENTCQLCNMDKLVFSPIPLYCSRCNLRIKRNFNYYWAQDETGSRHCFCTGCFKVTRGSITLQQGISFSKSVLQRERNNAENEESWVQCDKCGCWQHQICGLYNAKIDTEGKAKYICPYCRLKDMEIGTHVPLAAFFGAKNLPRTKLSDYIEKRLFKKLKREKEERAKYLGKGFDEVPGAAELVVRVVLSANKLLRVKQQFLDIFPDESYPAEFPYKSKVILLFQNIEGVDVCLFGMYVQEFGSECDHPNQRSIYISYLDSVKYFRPEMKTVSGEALRTFVYQEILIGYLDYCKKRGFATCYLWACPPIKGEDYVLYCHPETQKTPKPEKLRQWYKSMLNKALEEDVVVDYTTLYDRFFIPCGECSTKITAAHLPYFDGGYWSGAAEEMIRDMGRPKGESERKVKNLSKRTLKSMGVSNLTVDATKDILVMQKLGNTILPVKEDFLVVHLLFTCKKCRNPILSGARWFCHQCKNFCLCSRCLEMDQTLNETKTHTSTGGEEHLLSQVLVNDIPADTAENDVILDNNIFENRHSFLSFCQGNQYQFDTLRRAKHSSMMVLYDLHKKMPSNLVTTCNICFEDVMVEAGWHCGSCPSFDICSTCYHKRGTGCHSHKLVQHLNDNQVQQKKAFQVSILNALDHASRCRPTRINPCSDHLCVKTRKLFHHSGQCKLRKSGGCQFCWKVWFMIRTHSRACKDSNCLVPRCLDLRKHAEMYWRQSH